MTLGSIVVRLSMATADFETDTARAAKIAEKRAKELDASFRKAGVAIGLALSAAVVGVSKAVKDSIDHMDELSKSAQRVGLPTEDFSQLAYAGSLADVSMEDLQGSLGKLVKGMGDAQRDTSIQSKLFKALGIDVLDASGKMRSAKDVLYDFADAFKRQEGSPEIIAAGMNIFGRSFQKIIPLIKDGSAGLREMAAESDALGKTLSTQAGQQAEQFNDNITRLQSALGGLAQNVAADLLPDLVDLTNQFVGLVKEGHGAGTLAHDIADGFRIMGSAAESSVTLVSGVATVVGGLTQQLAGFYEMAAALGNFDWERRAKGAAMYQAGGAQVGVGADRLLNPHGANGLFNGADTTNYNFMDGHGSPAAAAAQTVGSYSGALLAPSKALADALKDQASAAQAIRNALGDPEKASTSLREREAAARKAAAAYADLTHADEAQMRQSYATVDAGTDAMNHWADLQAMLEGPLKAAENDHIRRVFDIEKTATAAGASATALATALGLEGEAHKRLIKDLKDQDDAMRNPGLVRAMDNFRGIAEDFLVDLPVAGGKAWKQFGDDLERLFLRLAAQDIVKSLFGDYGATGSGSAAGGWMGALFSGLFGGQRAGGGGVDGSKLYEVGEGGRPELFQQNGRTYLIPGNDGHVSPAGSGSFGAPPSGVGAGIKVEVINNGSPMSATASKERMPDGTQLIRVMLDAVADDLSNGGKVARAGKGRYGWREVI